MEVKESGEGARDTNSSHIVVNVSFLKYKIGQLKSRKTHSKTEKPSTTLAKLFPGKQEIHF